MKQLVEKYAAKLVTAGFAEQDTPLVGGLDAELTWNRPDPLCDRFAELFANLSINSLLFARPAEPYWSIIQYLAARANGSIEPHDSESRTIMHDLPIVGEFTAAAMVSALRRRKSVIVPGHGVVTWGTVSPEQGFIFFSSLCFACFVKFFTEFLADSVAGTVCEQQRRVFEQVAPRIRTLPENPPELMRAPFASEAEVYRAVSEAGRCTVELELVDSFFGNVSCLWNDVLYISQTGSSLDELEGCIDPCRLDGTSCAGITASSELTAHREIVRRTGRHAVLHGHPKFSVILSMDCRKQDCERRGCCHTKCAERRFVQDIPIVPGEVGTGPYGLCNTLPPAMEGRRGVIVYGHGLFTTGQDDFNEAFANLLAVEKMCQTEYFARVGY